MEAGAGAGREELGDVLRELIRDRTQAELAHVAGISGSNFHNWLNNRSKPQRKTLTQAADAWQAKGWISLDLRARLFRAAGYFDPEEPDRMREPQELYYVPVQEAVDLKRFRQTQGLPEEDIQDLNEQVELMIEQRRRRRGLN